jgi:hypothetical protein
MIDAGKCWKCKCQIWLPDELYLAAKASSSISIHCGYGHAGIFREGPTDLDKMRQERDRLAQQIAQKDDRIKELRDQRDMEGRKAAAARGQVTKIKNRVGRGVCPCCNRTFENLARHMGTKHPTFTAEAAE